MNELLLVEYHCPIDEPRFDIWSHHNYFVYVIDGIKKWRTLDQEMQVREGDCLFVRKGAHSVVPNTATTPCELMLFMPDDFIRSVIMEHRMKLSRRHPIRFLETALCTAPTICCGRNRLQNP